MTDNPGYARTLQVAAFFGELNEVRQFVAQGTDVNAIDEVWEGRTALMAAVEEGHADVVAFLLAHGTDPNLLKKDRKPFLHYAIDKANAEIVAMLLRNGVDVDAINGKGEPALYNAVLWSYTIREGNWVEITRLLVEAGADVNYTDQRGVTLLMHAAQFPAKDPNQILSILLKAGADVDAVSSEDRWTALMYAVNEKNPEGVRMLLEAGANVNIVHQDGDTAWNMARRRGYADIADILLQAGSVEPADVRADLHKAIRWGKTGDVTSLLEQGANPNSKDRYGSPAIMAAIAFQGNIDIVRKLLDYGADVNGRDQEQQTPLMHAARSGHREIVRLLLERGADVHLRMDDNMTALMTAIEPDNVETVRILLEAGAEVNAGDWENETALIEASRRGYMEIVTLLLNYGADINASTANIHPEYYGGATPLIEAAKSGHTEVVQLLLDRGANVNAEDAAGWSALDWAMDEGPDNTRPIPALVQLLRDRSAKAGSRRSSRVDSSLPFPDASEECSS